MEYVAGGHARNKLDLYLPAKADHPLPVIVWIHGGGWYAGSKGGCPAVPLIAKGYAVASINYRLSQHALFPAQIEDCKASIRWLRANAKKYNLDPNHVGVAGASAGGHLAALLGTTGSVKELEGNGGNTSRSAWLEPPGALPISAHRAPGGIGSCDHRRASSIFSHARDTASAGISRHIIPPG